ncbi:MAG: tail fiber domain-containing protein [Verrucomicrobiales bacterium]
MMLAFNLAIILSARSLYAQSINYQGELRNADGSPFADGAYGMIFRLYDATAEADAWMLAVSAVQVNGGHFNVELTGGTPLLTDVLPSLKDPYLEIKVGTNPPIAPRQRLAASPRAFVANTVRGIDAKGSPKAIEILGPNGNRNVFTTFHDSTEDGQNRGSIGVSDESGATRARILASDQGGSVKILSGPDDQTRAALYSTKLGGHLRLYSADYSVSRTAPDQSKSISRVFYSYDSGSGRLDFSGIDGVTRVRISDTPGGHIGVTSDRRLKERIEVHDHNLEIVEGLHVKKYFWKGSGQADVGMIAQEVAEVFPLAVIGKPDGDVKADPMMVNYTKFIPLLVGAVQEQQAQIELLSGRLEKQSQQIVELRATLDAHSPNAVSSDQLTPGKERP